MRIIEPGKDWTLITTCTGLNNPNKGCGAKLELERDDLFITREFEREGDGAMCVTFRCPSCSALTDLPKANWPNNAHQLRDK